MKFKDILKDEIKMCEDFMESLKTRVPLGMQSEVIWKKYPEEKPENNRIVLLYDGKDVFEGHLFKYPGGEYFSASDVSRCDYDAVIMTCIKFWGYMPSPPIVNTN